MGQTIYEQVGGDGPFWSLARAFYARVQRDTNPSFRRMFPEELTEPIRNQAEFLIQYFGGPTAYSERKGHPRLRMRHALFQIDQTARDRWMSHMRGALEDTNFPEPARSALLTYFDNTATFLINSA